MPEYLSKEEVKQWRSSLEKITLEEYAARLGKVIEEEKRTNDLVDIVLKGQSVITKIDDFSINRSEKISSIAQKAFEREKQISQSSFANSIGNKKTQSTYKKGEKPIVKIEAKEQVQSIEAKPTSLREEVRLVFNKALTEREQLVFDYFANNQNKIVYAKDLAKLLDLPRDYVYKYIKNLRTKIDGDRLQNAENGGYVLSL